MSEMAWHVGSRLTLHTGKVESLQKSCKGLLVQGTIAIDSQVKSTEDVR